MFLDLAEQRNFIASRSTNVTFARSIDFIGHVAASSARRRSTSGRYSFVSCPQSRTLNDLSSPGVGLIFNTVYDFLSYLSGTFETKCFITPGLEIDAY